MVARRGLFAGILATVLAGCSSRMSFEDYEERIRQTALAVDGVASIKNVSYTGAWRSMGLTVVADSDDRARMLDIWERLMRAVAPTLDEPGQGRALATIVVAAPTTQGGWVDGTDAGLDRSITFDEVRKRYGG